MRRYIFFIGIFFTEVNYFCLNSSYEGVLFQYKNNLNLYEEKISENQYFIDDGMREFLINKNNKPNTITIKIYTNEKDEKWYNYWRKVENINNIEYSNKFLPNDYWNRYWDFYLKKIKNIPCLYIKSKAKKSEKKNLIVGYHGNALTFLNFPQLFDCYTEDYDILIPELPGYPFNENKDFSEETRIKQIIEIGDWILNNYIDKEVKIVSHSLGNCYGFLLASYLSNREEFLEEFKDYLKDTDLNKNNSSKNKFKYLKLISICPFLRDINAVKHLVGSNSCMCCGSYISSLLYPILDNSKYVKGIQCDIDMFYAPYDKVVDPKDSLELYKIKKEQKNKSEYKKEIRLRALSERDIEDIEKEKKSENKEIYDDWNDIILNCTEKEKEFFLGNEKMDHNNFWTINYKGGSSFSKQLKEYILKD